MTERQKTILILAMVLCVISFVSLIVAKDQRAERFEDMAMTSEAVMKHLKDMPPPQELMKQIRTLLDKYDKPEVWNHATQMIDKDPAALARINLGLQ